MIRESRNFAVLAGTVLFLIAAGGCASSREDIPGSARMVAEGNERLTYQVPRGGTVYIYDDDADKLVYTGEVDRDETITIDSEDDRLMIGSRRATEYDLDPDHRMQIYFEEDLRDARPARERYRDRDRDRYR